MPEGQEDSKRTPRPRERRSRTQGTDMHYRPRYVKATASCWKSVKWYSAQKNRDNRCTRRHWRYIDWTRPATRSSRRGFSQSPCSWFFDTGHQKLWRRKNVKRSYHHQIQPGTRARVSGVVVTASICQLHLWSLLHIWVKYRVAQKIPFVENKSTWYFRNSLDQLLDHFVVQPCNT